MKKIISLVVLAILFIAMMVGAWFVYGNLTEYKEPARVEQDETLREIEAIQAIDFPFTDIDGNQVNLSDFYGKPTVLNVWASWCPPCKGEMPYFDDMYKEYGNDVNFIMLNATDGVQETENKAREFLQSVDYEFPVYFDYCTIEGELLNQLGSYIYGITSLPTTFFISEDGYVEYAIAGAITKTILQEEIYLLLK